MDHSKVASKSQAGIQVSDQIDDFFDTFRIGTLLNRVFDHSTGRYLKGFCLLTVCWFDGVSCLPLDFALLSSAKEKNHFYESHKSMDKRCCAFTRRKEATTKATALLVPMVNRILWAGIHARYVLMDSWFTMPPTVCTLRKHLDVIV